VTQLHDDVNDLDDAWYAGRLDPSPETGSETELDAGSLDATRLDGEEFQALAPDRVSGGGEPLFEELREAYLHGEDSGEWAGHTGSNGSGTWTDDSSGEWESGSHTGWDEDEDELDEDDDELEAEPFAPRARRTRRVRSAQGRVAWRRTSTLLNASTFMITAVGVLAAMALTGLIISSRVLTTRQLFFLAHSSFGIVIVHAFGGGLGTLLTTGDSRMKDRIRKLSTAALAVVAWLASATGTWFGYAGYRAQVPPGGDIGMYPREYLLRSPDLAFWETFAMEWKVHIGWTTPFLATAVAFVALRYRRRLVADRLVRKVMTNLLVIAFAGALVAAVLGAVVNVTAPNDFMHRGWSP
jgi:hypothetical protein